jgi:putative Mg2+ transporter-C (MgtC) family protein
MLLNWYDVIIRLMLAVIIGGAVGYEREYKNMPAGFRTHILVCIGAAVVSMIQINMVSDTLKSVGMHPELANILKADSGRLGAQVISGVGFLGAGTIIHDKGSVKGLTTAASLWGVACIGLGVGMGYYYLSISAAVAIFLVLVTLKRFEDKFIDKSTSGSLEIKYLKESNNIKNICSYLERKNIKISNIEYISEEMQEDLGYKTVHIAVVIPKYIGTTRIIEDVALQEGVIKVSLL